MCQFANGNNVLICQCANMPMEIATDSIISSLTHRVIGILAHWHIIHFKSNDYDN